MGRGHGYGYGYITRVGYKRLRVIEQHWARPLPVERARRCTGGRLGNMGWHHSSSGGRLTMLASICYSQSVMTRRTYLGATRMLFSGPLSIAEGRAARCAMRFCSASIRTLLVHQWYSSMSWCAMAGRIEHSMQCAAF